jgi:1,4-dihydroxy-2-naphthoyl-CoA hydrolase
MARIWRDDVSPETLRALGTSTLIGRLGIELLEFGDDYRRAGMLVDDRTCQSLRFMHGGAAVALAESLATLGAAAVVDLTSTFTRRVSANHLRLVREGARVTGVARLVERAP